MADYIDRNELVENLDRFAPEHFTPLIRTLIEKQPTADVEEVKHGYWKDRYNNKYVNHLYECSVCSKEALFESYKNELDQWNERQALTPVCPHCGAEMDGERKHSN